MGSLEGPCSDAHVLAKAGQLTSREPSPALQRGAWADSAACTVDTQAVLSGHALLEAVGAAEREVAATAAQEPVGQWEAVRVRPVLERGAGTSQALLASPAEAKAALEVCLPPE